MDSWEDWIKLAAVLAIAASLVYFGYPHGDGVSSDDSDCDGGD